MNSHGTILDAAQLDALSPPLVSTDDFEDGLRQQGVEEGDVAVGIYLHKSVVSDETLIGRQSTGSANQSDVVSEEGSLHLMETPPLGSSLFR